MKDITGGALQRSFFMWVLTPLLHHYPPPPRGRRAQRGGENLATVTGFGTRNSQHLVPNRMCTGPTALPAAPGHVASGVITTAFMLNTYHAPSRLLALLPTACRPPGCPPSRLPALTPQKASEHCLRHPGSDLRLLCFVKWRYFGCTYKACCSYRNILALLQKARLLIISRCQSSARKYQNNAFLDCIVLRPTSTSISRMQICFHLFFFSVFSIV